MVLALNIIKFVINVFLMTNTTSITLIIYVYLWEKKIQNVGKSYVDTKLTYTLITLTNK